MTGLRAQWPCLARYLRPSGPETQGAHSFHEHQALYCPGTAIRLPSPAKHGGYLPARRSPGTIPHDIVDPSSGRGRQEGRGAPLSLSAEIAAATRHPGFVQLPRFCGTFNKGSAACYAACLLHGCFHLPGVRPTTASPSLWRKPVIYLLCTRYYHLHLSFSFPWLWQYIT